MRVAARSGALPQADRVGAFAFGARAPGLFPAAAGVARGRFAALTSPPAVIAFSGPLAGGASLAGLFAPIGGVAAAGALASAFAAVRDARGGGGGGEIASIAAEFAELIEDAARRGDFAEVARLQQKMRQRIRDAQGRGKGGGGDKGKGRRSGGRGCRPTTSPNKPTLG